MFSQPHLVTDAIFLLWMPKVLLLNIFHFFSYAAEGKIVVMQSSLGCSTPSSWRARCRRRLPAVDFQGVASLSIPLFSISFQRRSQLVIESSKGCFPLSLLAPLSLSLVSFMVSAPFNLLHVENNKVAAIPCTWLAQPFNTEARGPSTSIRPVNDDYDEW